MEIPTEGSATRRQSRTCEETGSVVTVNLEALAHGKEKTSADATEARMSTHLSSGGLKAPRVYLRNRLLRRDRERKARDRARERQMVTGLLETLVSPSSDGTESCQVEMCVERNGKKRERERNWKGTRSFLSRSSIF